MCLCTREFSVCIVYVNDYVGLHSVTVALGQESTSDRGTNLGGT